jgi:hypothetical protein
MVRSQAIIDESALLYVLKARTFHRVGLSRASLAVSEDADIHSVYCCLDKRLDLVEDILLTLIWHENCIVVVNVLAVSVLCIG